MDCVAIPPVAAVVILGQPAIQKVFVRFSDDVACLLLVLP